MDHRASDVGERAPGIRLIGRRVRSARRGTVLLGFLGIALAAVLAACGGGGGSSAPVPLALPAGAISGPPAVAAACTGGSTTGSFFANAEVEPFVAIDPGNSNHLVATWQQDRWTDGGARHRDGGLVRRRTQLDTRAAANVALRRWHAGPWR
ncbi:MAG TPA: hypothetical protein VF319_17910 [Caldimonas sp.]